MKVRRGVTLMELMIVTTIIGILATLAIINYTQTREFVWDKEAIAHLKMLQTAELGYRMDTGDYYPDDITGSQSNVSEINQNLKVLLPYSTNRNWNYIVYSNGCAQATRNGGDGRSWYFRIDDKYDLNNPICSKDGEPNKDCYTCP